jgi:hypothetical protein
MPAACRGWSGGSGGHSAILQLGAVLQLIVMSATCRGWSGCSGGHCAGLLRHQPGELAPGPPLRLNVRPSHPSRGPRNTVFNTFLVI